MRRTLSAETLRREFYAFAKFWKGGPEDLEAELAKWPKEIVAAIADDWLVWARDDQLPPTLAGDGGADWRTWLFLGGRGAGKTRAGAEWVRATALSHGRSGSQQALRIALVGQTIADVRAVMVEGQSGLLAVHRGHERPTYEAAKNRLVWRNGTIAQFFSAERPAGLRGPQFHAAWCDELVKWRHAEETWDMLQFGLRLGTSPQAVVTTTPKPISLLKRLLSDPATVVSRATTFDNRANLAAGFFAEIERRYRGTVLGRQELDGEVIEDQSGALWRRDWIEETRRATAAEFARVVVAVDPPVTAHAKSDACGIVVAARGVDRRGYVIADRTLKGRSPDVWARAAVAAFNDFEADCIVVEVNQGGDLVEGVLRQVADGVPIKKVRATRGKWLRAEPVAALYAEGRVSHVGDFRELEDQLLGYGTSDGFGGRSPDRLDALVWALTELMIAPSARPSLRRI